MAYQRGLALSVLLLMAVGVQEVQGQGGFEPVHPAPVVMLGYVANAPDQLLGGGVAFLPPALRGWGLYADAKTHTSSPEDDPWFRADLTPEDAAEFGDLPQDEESVWTTFNVALVRAFQDDLIVYLGGGASRERMYAEYFDPSRERAEFGYYWIPDTEPEAWRPNVMGGMFFRIMRHVMVQVGAESAPRGFTVGILAVL